MGVLRRGRGAVCIRGSLVPGLALTLAAVVVANSVGAGVMSAVPVASAAVDPARAGKRPAVPAMQSYDDVARSTALASALSSRNGPPVPVLGRVELPEYRTATSVVYRNADGSLEQRVYGAAINYWDGSAFQAIDNSLVGDGSGGYRNAAAATVVRYGARADAAGLVSVGQGSTALSETVVSAAVPSLSSGAVASGVDRVAPPSSSSGTTTSTTSAAVGVQPPAAVPPAPVAASVSGNRLAFQGVWPGVDVRYEQFASGVKESLVIAGVPSSAADSAFAFDLQLGGALTPTIASDGSVSITDPGGTRVYAIPAPVVSDSARRDEPPTPVPAHATLTDRGGGVWRYAVVVDGAWLADPARVYPVTVDPTVVFGTGYTGNAWDAYVVDSQPNTNYDQDWDATLGHYRNMVGQCYGCTVDARAYLYFDVSQLQPYPITSATLNLWWYYMPAGGDGNYQVHPVSAGTGCGWQSNTITWNNQPTSFGAVVPNAGGSTATLNAWSTTPVTATVQGWAAGTSNNCGLMIDTNQAIASQFKEFAATEDGPYPSAGPFLSVVYSGAGMVEMGNDPYARFDNGVNTGSGNFTYTYQDLQVPAADLNLEVSRTYNSLDPKVGWFGVGWSSSWEMRAYANPYGETIVYPDGRSEAYYKKPDGSYVSPPGHRADIAVAFGAVTVTDLRHKQYLFDALGRLTRITTFHGVNSNSLVATYAGSTNQVTSIQAQFTVTGRPSWSSRTITVHWTASKIDYIQTNAAQYVDTAGNVQTGPVKVTYQYDTAGNLWKACSLANCTVFSYTGTPEKLDTITTARGYRKVKLVYTSVRGQVQYLYPIDSDDVHKWTYVYSAFTPDSSCPTGVNETTVTEPGGSTQRTYSVYDGVGRLVCRWEENYKLTQQTYDSNGFLQSVTTPAYDSAGDRGTRTTYRDKFGNITHDQLADGTNAFFEYNTLNDMSASYDVRCGATCNGNVAWKTTYGYYSDSTLYRKTLPPTADAPAGRTYQYGYTNENSTTTGTCTLSSNPVPPSGLIAYEQDPAGNRTTYKYDACGDLRERDDPTGTTANPTTKVTTYGYDALGRRTSETVTSHESIFTTTATTTTRYDQVGRVRDVTDPPVTNGISGITHQRRATNTYDADNNVVTVTESDLAPTGADPTRTTDHGFDASDREVSTTLHYTDTDGVAQVATTTKHYDIDGRVDLVTDARGTTIQTTYTIANQPALVELLNYVDPKTGVTAARISLHRYSYYDNGTLKDDEGPFDANNQAPDIQYTYRADGKLLTKVLVNYTDPINGGGPQPITLEQHDYQLRTDVITTDWTANGRQRTDHSYDADRFESSTVTWLNLTAGNTRTSVNTRDLNGNVTQVLTTEHHNGQPSPPPDRTRRTTTAYGRDDTVTQTIAYNDNGQPPLITDYIRDELGLAWSTTTNANTTTTIYDTLARPTWVIAPAVTVTGYGQCNPAPNAPASYSYYDTFGDVVDSKDANCNVAHATFDEAGRKIAITYPSYTPVDASPTLTPVEKFWYDKNGNLTKHQDRRGNQTSYAFDQFNRVWRQTDPQLSGQATAGVTDYDYDYRGNKTDQWDQNGAHTVYSYDYLNKPYRTDVLAKDSVGGPVVDHNTYRHYDASGNVDYTKKPGCQSTATPCPTGSMEEIWTAYNNANELGYTITEDSGSYYTEVFEYWFGQRTTDTLPSGRYTTTTYTMAGQKRTETAYAADNTSRGTTTYAYDASNRLTTETSPRGFTTTYSYNALDKLTQVAQVTSTSPAHTITTSAGYDANGNLTQIINGNGYPTTMTYTPWNQLETTVKPATATQPNLADRTWQRVYDAGGLAIKDLEPPNITINHTYDQLARRTGDTSTIGGTTDASRTLSYDKTGNLVAFATPTGTVAATYNEAGAPLTVGTSTTYSYDADGRPSQITDPAATTSYTWTARGRVASVSGGLTGTYTSYGYGPDNGLVVAHYKPSSGQTDFATRTITTDPVNGRPSTDTLVQGSTTVWSASYSYDASDNITAKTIGPAGSTGANTNTYGYDGIDRLTNWNSASANITWDDNSNRTAVNGVSFGYDERDRLVAGNGRSYGYDARGDQINDNGITSTYDALGRLSGRGSTSYSYDSLDRITTRGPATFAYQGTTNNLVVEGTLRYGRTPTGTINAVRNGAAAAVLGLQDLHGDLVRLFTTTGAITDTATYDPFGQRARTGATNPDLGYQGSYSDPTTNQDWFATRWYDPTTANFTRQDTLTGTLDNPISLNQYTYANGNPLANIDPTGQACVSDDGRGCWKKPQPQLPSLASVEALCAGYGIAVQAGGTPNPGMDAICQTPALQPGINRDVQADEHGTPVIPSGQWRTGSIETTQPVTVPPRVPVSVEIVSRRDAIGNDIITTIYRNGYGVAIDVTTTNYGCDYAGRYDGRCGYHTGDITDQWRRDQGGIDSLIRQYGQECKYRAASCRAAEVLIEGGSIDAAGAAWKCNPNLGDCDVGATFVDPVAQGVQDFVVGMAVAAGGAAAIKALGGAATATATETGASSGRLALNAAADADQWAGSTLSRVTQTDEVMYRVWGGGSGRAGEWLTPINPSSSAAARAGLALPEGNAATYVSRVVVPAGTRVQVGVAGEGFGQPGGWVQVRLVDQIPLESFGKGTVLAP